jgi:hypothetical protein
MAVDIWYCLQSGHLSTYKSIDQDLFLSQVAGFIYYNTFHRCSKRLGQQNLILPVVKIS